MAKMRPHFELPIADEFLIAIGKVITNWAYFEVDFDGSLKTLLLHPEAAKLYKVYPKSFKKRTALLKETAAVCFSHHAETAEWFIKLANTAARLRSDRDFVAHGRWVQRMVGKIWRTRKPSGKMETTLVSEGDWGRLKGKVFTLDQINKLAYEISCATADLYMTWTLFSSSEHISQEVKSQIRDFQRENLSSRHKPTQT